MFFFGAGADLAAEELFTEDLRSGFPAFFFAGVRPAINVGISVSRVGGSAQPKAIRKVAGRLRLDLAQYRELEAFAAFGSDLDAASKAQLARGGALVELLKQPQYAPFPMEEEVVSIWAGTTGRLDEVPIQEIARFEQEFLDSLRRSNNGVLDSIRDSTELSDDSVRLLEQAIDEFKANFITADGTPLVNEAAAKPLDEAEVDHAKITRVKG